VRRTVASLSGKIFDTLSLILNNVEYFLSDIKVFKIAKSDRESDRLLYGLGITAVMK
jgi:hypothetical protein